MLLLQQYKRSFNTKDNEYLTNLQELAEACQSTHPLEVFVDARDCQARWTVLKRKSTLQLANLSQHRDVLLIDNGFSKELHETWELVQTDKVQPAPLNHDNTKTAEYLLLSVAYGRSIAQMIGNIPQSSSICDVAISPTLSGFGTKLFKCRFAKIEDAEAPMRLEMIVAEGLSVLEFSKIPFGELIESLNSNSENKLDCMVIAALKEQLLSLQLEVVICQIDQSLTERIGDGDGLLKLDILSVFKYMKHYLMKLSTHGIQFSALHQIVSEFVKDSNEVSSLEEVVSMMCKYEGAISQQFNLALENISKNKARNQALLNESMRVIEELNDWVLSIKKCQEWNMILYQSLRYKLEGTITNFKKDLNYKLQDATEKYQLRQEKKNKEYQDNNEAYGDCLQGYKEDLETYALESELRYPAVREKLVNVARCLRKHDVHIAPLFKTLSRVTFRFTSYNDYSNPKASFRFFRNNEELQFKLEKQSTGFNWTTVKSKWSSLTGSKTQYNINFVLNLGVIGYEVAESQIRLSMRIDGSDYEIYPIQLDLTKKYHVVFDNDDSMKMTYESHEFIYQTTVDSFNQGHNRTTSNLQELYRKVQALKKPRPPKEEQFDYNGDLTHIKYCQKRLQKCTEDFPQSGIELEQHFASSRTINRRVGNFIQCYFCWKRGF